MAPMIFHVSSVCLVWILIIHNTHGFINENCDRKCVLAGNTYCGPIPCPYFPCDVPLAYTKGDCCEHCPTDKQDDSLNVNRRGDNATAACPFPCTINGHHFCHHIPCPLPPCQKPVTTHGDCCPHCPHGPTCTFKGVTILVGKTAVVDGLTCHCKAGGIQGLVDCV